MPTQTMATGDVVAMADAVNSANDSTLAVPPDCSDVIKMFRFLQSADILAPSVKRRL